MKEWGARTMNIFHRYAFIRFVVSVLFFMSSLVLFSSEFKTKVYSREKTVYTNVVTIPLGVFVLIKKDRTYGAFRIVKPLEDKKGWQYEWGVLPANKNSSSKLKEAPRNVGEIYEDYAREIREDGHVYLVDKGSRLYITIDDNLRIEWSYPLWVYLPKNKKFYLTITGCKALKDLDPEDKRYVWYSGALSRK